MSKKTREPASLSATGPNPCIPRVDKPRTERTLSCRHDCGVEGEKFQKWKRIEERNKVDLVERWRREKSALWGSPALAVQEASIAGTPTMLGPRDLYRSCIGVSANIYLCMLYKELLYLYFSFFHCSNSAGIWNSKDPLISCSLDSLSPFCCSLGSFLGRLVLISIVT